MKTREIYEEILKVARISYEQGRNDQFEEDFPDVGMSFSRKFEDTEIYEAIMEKIGQSN